ncbi:MAG: hypothetical protein ACXACY_22850, partial [Candidatus Hodarchaeales archaeon]
TINISRHGVLLPRRIPPPVGTHVKLTITIRDETSIFKGVVQRHEQSLVSGTTKTSIGIDIISSGYDEFVKDKISIT